MPCSIFHEIWQYLDGSLYSVTFSCQASGFCAWCEPNNFISGTNNLFGGRIFDTLGSTCMMKCDWEVTHELTRVQICSNVPDKDCKRTTTGEEYLGHTSVARNGAHCLPWAMFTSSQLHYGTLEENINYCRAATREPIDTSFSEPWCFTQTGPELCNISYCGNHKTNCTLFDAGLLPYLPCMEFF